MDLEQELHETHMEVTALRSQMNSIKWMFGVLITIAVAMAGFVLHTLSGHAAMPYHDQAGREIAALREVTMALSAYDVRLDAQIAAGFVRLENRIDRLTESVEDLRTIGYSRDR